MVDIAFLKRRFFLFSIRFRGALIHGSDVDCLNVYDGMFLLMVLNRCVLKVFQSVSASLPALCCSATSSSIVSKSDVI